MGRREDEPQPLATFDEDGFTLTWDTTPREPVDGLVVELVTDDGERIPLSPAPQTGV